jgi:hypothetical protein
MRRGDLREGYVLVASNLVRQFRNWSIDLIVVFASGKCEVFAGNPASNVRLVGDYLGTFRGHVFKIERYAA